MKTLKFLLAVLMLSISTLSDAQSTYINGEKITPMTKGDSVLAAKKDSVQVAGNQAVGDSTGQHAAVQTGHDEHKKMNPNQKRGSSWASWIMIGLVTLLVLGLVFNNPIAAGMATSVKSFMKGQDPSLADDAFVSNLQKKKGVCEQVVTGIGTKKINWDKPQEVDTFKRFMNWLRDYDKVWWRRMRYAGIFILCSGFLYVLYSFSQNPSVTHVTNQTLPAVITSTLTTVAPKGPQQEVIIENQSENQSYPQGRVYSRVFDVPGANEDGFKPITEDWKLPYNEDGWHIRVKWRGRPIWYPTVDNFEQYIDMIPGENVNIGQNPSDMNFSFQSLDGLPAEVTLEYWSRSPAPKVGV